jgi:hypothetical protein
MFVVFLKPPKPLRSDINQGLAVRLGETLLCSGVTQHTASEERVSKWRLHCLVARIKGKAVQLHEREQGISNRSALREEIIKRDVGVVEGERNTD